MRNSILTFILFASLPVASIGQDFEGKVVYQSTFRSKVPNVTDDMFTQMMGSSVEYNLKDGNYRTSSNGTYLLWQIYIKKDNKIYTKTSNSPSIYWNDGLENKDEVLKSELKKNAEEILGYPCDELVLTCKSGVQKYYFNSKFKIDPKLYENHKFGNFYDYVSKSKAVPLKIVIENAQFTMESIAASIEVQKIDDGLFNLPADAVLEKNPYN